MDGCRDTTTPPGLGLAIVKQLTEAQGGSVSADSEPGRGSSFTVTFPLVPQGTRA
ncbi:MAG TPA: ATP-binding protein [Dehalococcoidia bacterium]|nr:ATP-binding protein [Dehalococcoidia bacterium]